MTGTKESTCKYNANRKLSKLIKAYCTWRYENIIPSPPHIAWTAISYDVKCKNCKVYIHD